MGVQLNLGMKSQREQLIVNASVYQWLDSDIANVKAVGSNPITRSKYADKLR